LVYPAPGKRIELPINAIYYDNNNKVINNDTCHSYVESNWKRSKHALGWGNSNGCAFKPGQYKVVLSINGEKIAEDFFIVE
jgi:hypothetical protein